MQDMHRRPQNHIETSQRRTRSGEQRPSNNNAEEISRTETLLPENEQRKREKDRTATKEPQS